MPGVTLLLSRGRTCCWGISASAGTGSLAAVTAAGLPGVAGVADGSGGSVVVAAGVAGSGCPAGFAVAGDCAGAGDSAAGCGIAGVAATGAATLVVADSVAGGAAPGLARAGRFMASRPATSSGKTETRMRKSRNGGSTAYHALRLAAVVVVPRI